MQRKTILLIPSSYYLSDDVFEKIAFSSHHSYVYLDPQESVYKKINISHRNGFGGDFANIISLTLGFYSGSNRVLKFLSYQIKKIQILWTVLRIRPDLVIAASDGTFTARIVARFFSKIPFIVLQTALIAVDRDKYFVRKRSVLKGWIVKLLGFIFFPFGFDIKPYGLNHTESWLFLWGESSANLLRPYITNQKIRLVGNPVFQPGKKDLGSESSVLFLAPDANTKQEIQEFCEHAALVAKELSNLNFYIRLHPIMSREPYELFFRGVQLKNVFLVSQMETLDESIQGSKIIISEYSAATFNALAMGREVILYKKESEAYLSHWFNEIDIFKVRTTRGVIESLKSLDSSEKKSIQNQIKGHWCATGDEALRNILNGIDNILKGI